MTTTSPWVKASRSGDSGNCVEMRSHAGTVEVQCVTPTSTIGAIDDSSA